MTYFTQSAVGVVLCLSVWSELAFHYNIKLIKMLAKLANNWFGLNNNPHFVYLHHVFQENSHSINK